MVARASNLPVTIRRSPVNRAPSMEARICLVGKSRFNSPGRRAKRPEVDAPGPRRCVSTGGRGRGRTRDLLGVSETRQRWPSGTPTSREDGENDDRILCEDVTYTVVLHQEVAKTGVRLMQPHGVHLWKFRDHLDSTEDGLPHAPEKVSEGASRGFGPKDPHRAFIRRRAGTTRAWGTSLPLLRAARPASIASFAWRCERIPSSIRSTLSRSAKYRRASLTTKLLLPARGWASAFSRR